MALSFLLKLEGPPKPAAPAQQAAPVVGSYPSAPVHRTPPLDVAAVGQQGLPLAIQKQLLSRITPLSSAAKGLPQRQTLRHFWQEVEDALEGISSAFKVEQIDTAAANRLAPLVLGAPLFAQM